MDVTSPDMLIHFYDELTESRAKLSIEEYRRNLIQRGLTPAQAASYCALADPQKTGYIRRDALCNNLNYWPKRPQILDSIEIIASDMPIKRQETFVLLILTCLKQRKTAQDRLNLIKERVEDCHGPGWTIYLADGRYWAINSHTPGTNLVFKHKGIVYGIFQAPSATDNDDTYSQYNGN